MLKYLRVNLDLNRFPFLATLSKKGSLRDLKNKTTSDETIKLIPTPKFLTQGEYKADLEIEFRGLLT